MEKFTSFDGTQIAYSDTGSGVPVLCLSGLTRNAKDFGYVAPHLSDTRMICMDYRGRGQSDCADPATYTIQDEGRDVLALLDHLALDQVGILGTSRGGIIAMGLASVARARLLGVCLNDIGPVIDPAGLSDIAEYLGHRPAQKTYAEAAKARHKTLPGFANVPPSRWREEVEIHFTETADGLDITYDPALRDAVLATANLAPPDLWDWFEAMNSLPLALIRGESSNILSHSTAAEMARSRPDMIWAEVPDRGHVPFLDEPAAVAAIETWTKALL